MGLAPTLVITQSRFGSVGSRALAKPLFASRASQWFLSPERWVSPPRVSIFHNPEPVSRKKTWPKRSTAIPDPVCARTEGDRRHPTTRARSVRPNNLCTTCCPSSLYGTFLYVLSECSADKARSGCKTNLKRVRLFKELPRLDLAEDELRTLRDRRAWFRLASSIRQDLTQECEPLSHRCSHR